MEKTLIWLIVIVIVLIGGYYLFFNKQPVSGEEIKIGVPFVLSGDGAAWGENAQKGVNLAVEEINKKGGVNGRKIDVIYENTEGEAKKAVSAYQKLVSVDKVEAILGPLLQTETASVAPLIAKDNIPVIAPSYAAIQNRPNPRNPLLIWMDPTIEAGRMAEYVFKQGIRKMGVIGTLDSWENEVSEAFAEKFKSLGGEVVVKEIVQPDTSDVKLNITRIVNEKPEAIFLGTYFQFIQSLKMVGDLGYKGKLYSIEVDSYLANETKSISSGLRFIAPDFYTSDFMKKFEEKYGQKPGIPAGQAYDAMNILISLLAQAKNKEGMLDLMAKLENYKGVSGNIVLTEDHKTLFPTAVFEIQDGQFVKVE